MRSVRALYCLGCRLRSAPTRMLSSGSEVACPCGAGRRTRNGERGMEGKGEGDRHDPGASDSLRSTVQQAGRESRRCHASERNLLRVVSLAASIPCSMLFYLQCTPIQVKRSQIEQLLVVDHTTVHIQYRYRTERLNTEGKRSLKLPLEGLKG